MNDMSYEMISDNELYHWGIKNMKWGVRRFQNEDGTLTEAGKRRYGDYTDDERKARAVKTGLIEADIKRDQKVYNSMSDTARQGKVITDEAGKLADRFGTKTYKTGPDASTMSDEELRQTINRLNMEQQYDRLTTRTETTKGAQFVKDALSLAGSALVVAGSVTAIMANMKTIRG